ncbi:glycosyltransferase family 2 protein, partial [Singulisphaera rosea]
MSDQPALSVVIAASDSASAVARTLASLSRNGNTDRVEIIVVAGCDLPLPACPTRGVRWIEAPAKTGVPGLRGLGVEAARAPVVAFTEDSCTFAVGWCDSWIRAFEDPRLHAATGPVEPAMGNSPVEWAVFFCEYAPFLGGQGEHPRRLAGNNFAIRVEPGIAPDGEVHESEVHLEASARGALTRDLEEAIAYHVRRYGFVRSFAERLAFGL